MAGQTLQRMPLPTQRCIKLNCTGGGNFNIPIPSPASATPEDDAVGQFEDNISRSIVEAGSSSAWTLMHRYNKATELLDSVLSV